MPGLKALAAEPGMHWVEFDQCRFGLRGPGGGLHRKRTWVLTSSQEVADELHGQLCEGDHTHEHVIGGNVASLAGRYPPALAEAFSLRKRATMSLKSSLVRLMKMKEMLHYLFKPLRTPMTPKMTWTLTRPMLLQELKGRQYSDFTKTLDIVLP